MKLLIPYVDGIDPVDARLTALAAHLGIATEHFELPRSMKRVVCGFNDMDSSDWCILVNPSVLEIWAGDHGCTVESLVAELAHFAHRLLYAPRPKPFDTTLIKLLSGDHLCAVQEMSDPTISYEVAQDGRDICGAFAGLFVGRADSLTDHVFVPSSASSTARHDLISLRGLPFMALVGQNATETLFLGSKDIAALNAEVQDCALTPYFSRLAAPAMALRHIFAQESWHPGGQYASLIVDDPLLRSSYGFLNFQVLLDLMDRHQFHTSIAFIPHNWHRNSSTVVQMFRERPERLSICFHGNDHTGAEFATSDTELLNKIVGTADYRMSAHHSLTGLECGRIMVFPQGRFSATAMAVLKEHGFDAAVNTTFQLHQQPGSITLSQLIQPAVLQHAGFPLFLRDYSAKTDSVEIAFQSFFGRPLFLVEHHDAFRDPATLLSAVARINAVVPQVKWVSAGEAVRRALLWRKADNGTYRIRAYSSTVQVENTSASPAHFQIEWACATGGANPDPPTPQTDIVLDRGASTTVSIGKRRDLKPGHLGFQRALWGFVRRRLSEFRDIHLSAHPVLLDAAQSCHRRLSGRSAKN